MVAAVEQAAFRTCLVDICGLLVNDATAVMNQGYETARVSLILRNYKTENPLLFSHYLLLLLSRRI